jgi:hypothetical protein
MNQNLAANREVRTLVLEYLLLEGYSNTFKAFKVLIINILFMNDIRLK